MNEQNTNSSNQDADSDSEIKNPNKQIAANKSSTNSGPKKERKTYSDIFIANSIYPDAESVFSFELAPLQQIKDRCLVILDANVLIAPYRFNREDFIEGFLDQCRTIYGKLVKEERLIIPGQAAREFASNRANVLGELHDRLGSSKNLKSVEKTQSSILDALEEYKEITQLARKINQMQNEYVTKLNHLMGQIREWHWNDPVRKLYQEIFSSGVVYDPEFNRDEIIRDLDYREMYDLPPCDSRSKDRSKPDRGVGDLLIWRTILELSQELGESVIFVSGDKKIDWWDQRGLYARHELIDEFRKKTHNKSFHILELSQFLNLYGAKKEVVAGVRQEEVSREEELKKRSVQNKPRAQAGRVAPGKVIHSDTYNRIMLDGVPVKIATPVPNFQPNDLVIHAKYGSGRVLRSEPTQQGEMVRVLFAESGFKVILGSYLQKATPDTQEIYSQFAPAPTLFDFDDEMEPEDIPF